ncbi:hypothetical protein ASG94_03410 [Nocardioides sp. Soil805]|nr:hypothetical protein ASG94_03410 [Nocardioides sp. Soil805]
MRAEADLLDVPPPPLEEILGAGRAQRRRRRVLPVLGTAAAALLVGALVVVPGLRSGSSPDDGSVPDDAAVAVHERSGASFTSAQAAAAALAYSRGGAFAVGSTVYLGDTDHRVEIGDPAVRGLYYTSAGVLVRHGKDYAMDGSSRDGYSLVGTDGSVTGLDLHMGDVSPSTDPGQPYLAYARPASGDWEVVVLDLRSGEPAATVPVGGAFTWGGWDAPPVALVGDHVYVGLDDATVRVDWRSGEATTTPLPSSTYPAIEADRYLQIDYHSSADGSRMQSSVQVRDALSGETLLDLPDVGDRWASLSPDGEHVLVLPFMPVDGEGQIGRLGGAVLHSVDTGEEMPLPPSPVGGYGWTPDGLVFSVAGDSVTLCDPERSSCSTTPLPSGPSTEDGTLRLGGMVNES